MEPRQPDVKTREEAAAELRALAAGSAGAPARRKPAAGGKGAGSAAPSPPVETASVAAPPSTERPAGTPMPRKPAPSATPRSIRRTAAPSSPADAGTNEAWTKAATVVRQAEERARAVRKAAETKAEALFGEAQERARSLMAAAEEGAAGKIASAVERARSIVADAEKRAAALVAEAEEGARGWQDGREEAEREAAETLARSEREVASAVAEAQRASADVVTAAEQRAAALVTEAERASVEVLARAREEAAAITSGAEAEAAEVRKAANAHAAGVEQEADERAVRMIGDAEARAAELLADAEKAAAVTGAAWPSEASGALLRELADPLGAIVSAAALLGDFGAGLDEAGRARLVSEISDRAALARWQLERLADLVAAASGAVILVPERVAVSDVLTWAREAVAPSLVGYRVLVSHADVPTVVVDPAALIRVIGNALRNAAECSPPGGVIRVNARSEDGDLVITVSDDGAGVPAGEEDAVTRAFFRGSNHPRGVHGLGIGLSIAAAYATLLGGTVALDAREGVGATFTFRLPLAS